jgi:hypothetical protein
VQGRIILQVLENELSKRLLASRSGWRSPASLSNRGALVFTLHFFRQHRKLKIGGRNNAREINAELRRRHATFGTRRSHVSAAPNDDFEMSHLLPKTCLT